MPQGRLPLKLVFAVGMRAVESVCPSTSGASFNCCWTAAASCSIYLHAQGDCIPLCKTPRAARELTQPQLQCACRTRTSSRCAIHAATRTSVARAAITGPIH